MNQHLLWHRMVISVDSLVIASARSVVGMRANLRVSYLLQSLFCVVSLQLMLTASVYAAENKKILVLSSSEQQPYLEVIQGLREQAQAEIVEVFTSALSEAEVAQIIVKNNPDLLFTVGSEALRIAKQNTAKINIVAALVYKSTFFDERTTGVSLAYPIATQLEWLKKFLPERTKVAIMYNPQENNLAIQKMKPFMEQAGLDLLAIPVESAKQLPEALDLFAKDVDVLLTIPDELVLSPKTAKEILLATFRNKVPLVGISDNWVKSGALYALSWDYMDIGKQCAIQVQKILGGQAMNQVSPQTPRKLTFTINAKIAEHMNINIGAAILQNAKAVF